MTVKVGINGFGRIGRNFLRAAQAPGADVDFVGGERHHRPRDAGPPAEVRLGPRAGSTARSASTATASSSTATSSGSSPSATRPTCPGRSWAPRS